MRVRENSAAKTLIERRPAEKTCLKVLCMGRQVRLPSQARDHRPMRIGLPGILDIHTQIALPRIPSDQSLLLELGRFSRQEIAQRQSGVLGAELELTGGIGARQIIGCGMNITAAKPNLMPSPRPADVLGQLV